MTRSSTVHDQEVTKKKKKILEEINMEDLPFRRILRISSSRVVVEGRKNMQEIPVLLDTVYGNSVMVTVLSDLSPHKSEEKSLHLC